jgi:cell wall-associated NlpC family hydrolase
MPRQNMPYLDARNKMRPGDVIAFSGKGNFSEIIKWATRASVSHVGVVLQSKLLIEGDPQQGYQSDHRIDLSQRLLWRDHQPTE